MEAGGHRKTQADRNLIGDPQRSESTSEELGKTDLPATALEPGWIGAVRTHDRLRFFSWLVYSEATSVAPSAPRAFLSGSSLHTSSVYEKDNAVDRSSLISVDPGTSAP